MINRLNVRQCARNEVNPGLVKSEDGDVVEDVGVGNDGWVNQRCNVDVEEMGSSVLVRTCGCGDVAVSTR